MFVTNGYMSRQKVEDVAVWLDAANVALKTWSDDYDHKNCAGERDTLCPGGARPVIHRSMTGIESVELDKGKCRHCGQSVDGRWE